jgi:4-aminobutyrate aminotransferase-like enzyme
MTLREELNRYEPVSVQNLGQPVDAWDATGAKVCGLIDFTSGLLTANIGHDNPAVMAAVSKCRGWSGWYAPSHCRLAAYQALDSILPRYLDKYILLSTGSEAVDQAIKIAIDNGFRIITHERSYHGSTIGAAWAGGLATQPMAFFGHCGGLQHMGEYDNTAVMLETFIGPWCEWYTPSFIEKLRMLQKAGGIVIFDEMQAGFGRTGRWFGFEHYGITPDIVVGGKAAGGGFPVAFVAGRAKLMDKNPNADYVSTFSGNPFACLALEATVKYIRDNKLIEAVQEKEHVIRDTCERIVADGFAKRYTGKGFAYALHLDDIARAKRVVVAARAKGLLLLDTWRGTIKIAPPLVIGESELYTGMDIIRDTLKEVL